MQNRLLKNILVTGGAGFIGANFIRYLFSLKEFKGTIFNVDALTYAGNLMNLNDLSEKYPGRYFFYHYNICDKKKISELIQNQNIDTVINFAAESHVDRSIINPETFIKTNVSGTFNLLEAARLFWKDRQDVVFHQVSTDEVYGSLGKKGFFKETTPYAPRSPYSASKAAGDLIAKSYYHTYQLPVTVSNCSNNYGPYQFPEKLVPLMLNNMLENRPLPLYGDGKHIRDWIYVEDHISGIWSILKKGKAGESYNIGGDNEYENKRLVYLLCEIVAEEAGLNIEKLTKLITYVKDRQGHDRRYAIDCNKIKDTLGWKQKFTMMKGLKKTVRWYLTNTLWTERVKSGEYLDWIKICYNSC